MAYQSGRSLYRTKRGAMLGGVCAGLSECFRIDVSIIRVIALLLIFGFGSGIVLYILLWMVLPER